jgi:hypothetical protein
LDIPTRFITSKARVELREKREKEIKYENVKITQRIFNVENSGNSFQKAAVKEC